MVCRACSTNRLAILPYTVNTSAFTLTSAYRADITGQPQNNPPSLIPNPLLWELSSLMNAGTGNEISLPGPPETLLPCLALFSNFASALLPSSVLLSLCPSTLGVCSWSLSRLTQADLPPGPSALCVLPPQPHPITSSQ